MLRAGALILACALVTLFAPASLQAQDPVEDLKQALTLPLRLSDLKDPPEELLRYRRETLKKRIDALKTLGDLRRALALGDWFKETALGEGKQYRMIDNAMREEVAKRFTDRLRQVVQSDQANARLAAANMVAEMGPLVRSLDADPPDKKGFARTLTPEIIKLASDSDLAVRQEALRALGTINPPPEKAAAVFAQILRNPKEKVGPRRLAADGVGRLLRVANQLKSKTVAGVDATPEEVLHIAKEVLKTAPAGMQDADPQVRALCVQALQLAAQTISEQVQQGFAAKDFPPEDRTPTEEEKKEIQEKQDEVRAEVQKLQAHLALLADQTRDLAAALQHADPQVRLAALQALESIGIVRLKLARRLSSVPALSGAREDKGLMKLLAEHDPLRGFVPNRLELVTTLLRDPDVRLRRAAVDFLEVLEDAAGPTVPALTAALDDVDRFVRWSAARALGAVRPEQAAVAAPQLGRLLADPDLHVRRAAIATLDRLGPLASKAAAALALAAGEGDPESRMEAMQALWRIGPEAKVAVPYLIANLRYNDPRVRALAAETLGKIGPPAAAALPMLRQALGDDDQDVRIKASDAMLSIQGR